MKTDLSSANRVSMRARLARTFVRIDLALLPDHPTKPVIAPLLHRLDPQFRDCWLLMDRDTSAHDNAEHLYRHLREHHSEINAWFVLSPASPDWQRLEQEGFRLLPYGTARHARALMQCCELISSQIDHYVISPPVVVWLRRRPWRFTWLQHGVIQSDLSGWLNGKPVRTVVTTTPAEHRSVTRLPYVWTDREVVLTGLARHDALLRKASEVPRRERRLVVVMPTWRDDLLEGLGSGNERVARKGFWESQYVMNWLGLLRSPAVREAAISQNLELVFMPHPNIEPHIRAEHLPAYVRVASYNTDDVQSVLAHASHVVTDYSSNAFEAALLDRPVLYYQFDAEHFHSGVHIGRPGYFDYERDGFGPVVKTPNEAERALVSLLEAGKAPSEPYGTRIRRTFVFRDGQACRRIVHAVLDHAREP